jgi:hypothetical protein
MISNKTGIEKILTSLRDTNRSVLSTIAGLEHTISVISEYNLWRAIRGDLRSLQEDAESLSKRLVGYMDLIESEFRAEEEFELEQRRANCSIRQVE